MTRHDDNSCTPLWRLLLLTVALFAVLPAVAQNNPYKIHDELYAIYTKAFRLRLKHEGLELGEEMYRRAETLGDRKAQCMSLIILMQYHYHRKTDDSEALFEQAERRLRDFSRKNGYWQYFYYAVSMKSAYLLYRQRSADAILYTEEMAEYARRNNHVYGIFVGLKSMALIHTTRSEYTLAIDAYRQAIDLGNDYLPDQDMAPLYRRIAEAYDNLFDYGRMYEWARRGLAIAKTETARRGLMMRMCFAKFMAGDYAEFNRISNEYGDINPSTKELFETQLLAMRAIYDGDAERAEKFIRSISDDIDWRHKTLLYIELAKSLFDYSLQADRQTVFYRRRINSCDSTHSEGYGQIDSRITNMRIDFEHNRLAAERQLADNERQLAEIANASLELANMRLSLRNSSLELSRTKSRDAIVQLSYSRKKLEAERLRGEIETARARQAVGDTLLAGGALFGLLFLVAVGVYLRSRNRLMARLRTANHRLESQHCQLADALGKAQAADLAKSKFIQNMGEEIRRPLNAAVDSARLIAAAHLTADRERIESLNRQLQHDTQTMLDIVAGVLEKANEL